MGQCHARRDGIKSSSAPPPIMVHEHIEPQEGEPVYLNVYDLMIMNYTLNHVGLGVYHTGVEVYGREYSYAGHYHNEATGLKASVPRDTSWLHDASFRERILIGYTKLKGDEVHAKFEEMKPKYLGPSYNVLDRNCNHFTEDFLQELTGKGIPQYVIRMHRVAQKVRPCLPGLYKKDLRHQRAPPEYDSHKTHVPQPLFNPNMVVPQPRYNNNGQLTAEQVQYLQYQQFQAQQQQLQQQYLQQQQQQQQEKEKQTKAVPSHPLENDTVRVVMKSTH